MGIPESDGVKEGKEKLQLIIHRFFLKDPVKSTTSWS